MKNGNEYVLQIKKMAEAANAWRAANPERTAVVQFNFPQNVQVIATVRDAIERHFVYCDEGGLELLKAMGKWGEPDEPTVLMVRVALEVTDEEKAVN